MKDILKNRIVLGLACIVFSLIICFVLTPIFNGAVQSKVEIVRIAKDVAKGECIKAADIEQIQVGKFNLPKSVIKSKENVIGKYAKADLFIGDYVLTEKISSSPIMDNEYLGNLDGTKRAISVTIKSFAAGLSGKLEKGDIISLIASDVGELRETSLPAELQYVEVLAVTTSHGLDNSGNGVTTNADKAAESEKELPSTITLLVNPDQAKKLAELEEKSKLHAALVYRGDKANGKRFLDEQEKYFIKEATGNEQNQLSGE